MVTTNELLQREASSVVFDASVDDFIEHFGKKGMKWGVRQAVKQQGRLDRAYRLSTGTGSTRDKLLRGQLTKKGASRQLQRGADYQAKIGAGKKKVNAFLMGKKGRARLSKMDFHKKGDANAKLDRGQKAALAIGVGITFASIAGRR
jgi:hypothetical protein